LFKSIFSLYLIIFGCYILFTRIPDYFDGEKYPAIIELVKNDSTSSIDTKAVYLIGGKKYAINAAYPLLKYLDKEKIEVIVEHEHVESGAVYRFWGYWITWGELIVSIVMAIILFQVAVSITRNPTPEALMEQLSYTKEKKTKYD
jgi:hypothetical protein